MKIAAPNPAPPTDDSTSGPRAVTTALAPGPPTSDDVGPSSSAIAYPGTTPSATHASASPSIPQIIERGTSMAASA